MVTGLMSASARLPKEMACGCAGAGVRVGTAIGRGAGVSGAIVRAGLRRESARRLRQELRRTVRRRLRRCSAVSRGERPHACVAWIATRRRVRRSVRGRVRVRRPQACGACVPTSRRGCSAAWSAQRTPWRVRVPGQRLPVRGSARACWQTAQRRGPAGVPAGQGLASPPWRLRAGCANPECARASAARWRNGFRPTRLQCGT